jgi:hypothetical protein
LSYAVGFSGSLGAWSPFLSSNLLFSPFPSLGPVNIVTRMSVCLFIITTLLQASFPNGNQVQPLPNLPVARVSFVKCCESCSQTPSFASQFSLTFPIRSASLAACPSYKPSFSSPSAHSTCQVSVFFVSQICQDFVCSWSSSITFL